MAIDDGRAYATRLVGLKNVASGTCVAALDVAVPTWPTYCRPPLGFGLAVLVTLARAIAIAGAEEEAEGREAIAP